MDRKDRQAQRALPQSTILLTPSLGYSFFDRPPKSRIIALWKYPDSGDLDDPDDWSGLCSFANKSA
jgi:hypothetical protein